MELVNELGLLDVVVLWMAVFGKSQKHIWPVFARTLFQPPLVHRLPKIALLCEAPSWKMCA